jgi:tetratricopeptide (TPR) repeat protein
LEVLKDAYEGGNPSLENYAGSGYGLLGTLEVISGSYDTAIDYYRKAVQHALPAQRIFYCNRLARIYCRQGKPEEAGKAYQDAIDLARLYGYAEDVEHYTAKLQEHQDGGCR